ncbi:MAG: BMP family ABC transporter substrate-binding protein [Clostridia bacterium]|nr:BMP family ABC transporter substrate-binding protein [Clostridia bacterium]
MKKILAIMLSLGLIFGCAACGEKTDNESKTDTTSTASTSNAGDTETSADFKVALVTDVGSLDDESFNQATWEGVKTFCDANGVDYTYFQPQEDSTEERETKIAEAIAAGYNVIVMPGFLFGEALSTAQYDYPNVKFIAVDVSEGNVTDGVLESNAHCIVFSEEQAGYLAGYAAVKDGFTKLGFLGGMAVPAVIRYGYGFVQGADAAAEELGTDIGIKYTYGGQFYGDATITAKMEGWYSEGTEAVFACGGGIYTSALEAAVNHNAHVIGVDVDQSSLGADYINGDNDKTKLGYNPFLTSAYKGLANSVSTTLGLVKDGQWDTVGGKFSTLGLTEGDYVGLPTKESAWNFRTFTVEEYEAKKAEIMNGTVTVSDEASEDVHPTVGSHTTVDYIG